MHKKNIPHETLLHSCISSEKILKRRDIETNIGNRVEKISSDIWLSYSQTNFRIQLCQMR